jgi:hypothetical protein
MDAIGNKLHLDYETMFDNRVTVTTTDFSTYYTRDGLIHPNVEKELSPFMKGSHYLSVKQVPTALAIRRPGNFSVRNCAGVMRQCGFGIRRTTEEGTETLFPPTSRRKIKPGSSILSWLSDFDSKADLSDDESDRTYEMTESEILEFRLKGRGYSMVYEDFFKVVAGYTLADLRSGDKPNVRVWQGDSLRLHDPLPSRILGKTWTGKKTSKVRFQKISSLETKLHVLMARTFWGNKLMEMCKAQNRWALHLRKRITFFFKGKHDPSWNKRRMCKIYGTEDYELRSMETRSVRFIELLKTVDGMFNQRFLAFPNERWTWHKYDTFVLSQISCLLADEFLDGEITQHMLDYETHYEQLKKARKYFKNILHTEEVLKTTRSDFIEALPRWLRYFIPLMEAVKKIDNRKMYVLVTSILSQTRGCGTPPPLVVMRSRIKFLNTIQTPSTSLKPCAKALIHASLDNIFEMLPASAFTGLSTKARVTVTSSACWEHSRKEGGTLQAIQGIVYLADIGEKVPLRDLNTGETESWENLSTLSVGEYIFWACLDRVLKTPTHILCKAYMVTVKEPGKARTVTKALSYLKIVLDVVSKICSEPLKKGVLSSKSGMGKSSHGWNLFKDLFSSTYKRETFDVSEAYEEGLDGISSLRKEVYKDLWMLSTDYSTATDYLNHNVAKIFGGRWMRRCGIPKLLRGIVMKTCYVPREIYFTAKGCLSTIGKPSSDENVRRVLLVRGVLMGDPLTKVVLHLLNISVRTIPDILQDASKLEGRFNRARNMVVY